MGGTFTSQAKFYIDYSGGNFQLKRVDTLDEDDDSDVEVKTAVGVEGGAGHVDKEGGGALKLDVYRESNPEVNYRAVKKSKEVFSFSIQDVNGERWKYLGCRVAKVARKDDSQGKHMDSVDIKWLQRVPQPALF
jgi:hypothetical protein